MNATATVKSFLEGTLTKIPLKRIVDHAEIPHRDLNTEWVEELSQSIQNVGLDVPLIVWNGGGEKGIRMELGEGGEKVPASFLVAGNHRRAALKAFMKRDPAAFKERFADGIPCHVHGGSIADVLTAQLRENVMRSDMPAEQVFPVLKRLLKKEAKGGCGMSQKEVAKAIGKSTAWVSQILSIEEELGEEVVEALKKKEVGLSEARDAAGQAKKDKKAGKTVDKKAVVEKLKAKSKARKEKGKTREDRRLSAKVLWKRYLALPSRPMGEKKAILESALGYLAQDADSELAEELQADESSKEDESDESEE